MEFEHLLVSLFEGHPATEVSAHGQVDGNHRVIDDHHVLERDIITRSFSVTSFAS